MPRAMTQRERSLHRCKVDLQRLQIILREAKTTTGKSALTLAAVSKLSDQIHQMEYFQDLSQPVIDASKVLAADVLPAIKSNAIDGFSVP